MRVRMNIPRRSLCGHRGSCVGFCKKEIVGKDTKRKVWRDIRMKFWKRLAKTRLRPLSPALVSLPWILSRTKNHQESFGLRSAIFLMLILITYCLNPSLPGHKLPFGTYTDVCRCNAKFTSNATAPLGWRCAASVVHTRSSIAIS